MGPKNEWIGAADVSALPPESCRGSPSPACPLRANNGRSVSVQFLGGGMMDDRWAVRQVDTGGMVGVTAAKGQKQTKECFRVQPDSYYGTRGYLNFLANYLANL